MVRWLLKYWMVLIEVVLRDELILVLANWKGLGGGQER